MTECNAIIEANNEIDKLKRENKKLNALCVEYGFDMGRLEEENEQLKKELQIYRKVASCSNCRYHNYDWFDDGDEFEVCDKGNDVTDMICEEWEEL